MKWAFVIMAGARGSALLLSQMNDEDAIRNLAFGENAAEGDPNPAVAAEPCERQDKIALFQD